MKYYMPVLCALLWQPIYAQQGKRIDFKPTTFSNAFTLKAAPVLTVASGDTVDTYTIDAMGYDQYGVKRWRGGNPLTGPFYVQDAAPGDVLAVTLVRVALNRSYAKTTESFSSRSMPSIISRQLKKAPLVRWKLDTLSGYASLDTAYPHLSQFKVPLSPFPGCIGVAPGNKKNEILSFFQGPYGGNLDYRSLTQSTVVYLPVFHPGAYFYIGDGHALQGDGEIAGNALETSMNVSFSIRLIKKEVLQLTHPRAENATYIIALGTGSSQDEALKTASANLLEWLQKDYGLTLGEATQVISTSIEYDVAEIADPNFVIGAKIRKELLRGLAPVAAPTATAALVPHNNR